VLTRTMITSLIPLSRTCALYICYFVDVTSEEIYPEKCSYSEELSVKEIRIRHIREAVLRRTTPEETQPPALAVLSNSMGERREKINQPVLGNSQSSMDLTEHKTIHTIRDIKKGEEITI
jgi:hypothetical protein